MPLVDPSGRPIAPSLFKKPEPPGSAPAPSGPLIRDSSLKTFAADVLEASNQAPVIVDFWAPWCGPCKQLGPALEKAVTDARGRVRLVKVNIDENPELAQQLRIQSIPTVYAFRNGQPVDGFMGAIPESQIRVFVQQLADHHGARPREGDVLAAAEQAFAAGNIGDAAQGYGQVLQEESGHPGAVAGLAACYLKSGDIERAKATLQLARPDDAVNDAIRAVEAELKLREAAQAQLKDGAADRAALEARLAGDPSDHQARYDLALALDAGGDREGAVGQLLELVRRGKEWNDNAARTQLFTLFEAMGPTDPRTLAARRKLSSILFS